MTYKHLLLTGCILMCSNLNAEPIQNIQSFNNLIKVLFDEDKEYFLNGKDCLIANMINTSNATQIIADYQANELRADKKYKGKHIRIKSVIAAINNAIGNKAYIKLNGKNTYESVLIYFNPTDERYLKMSKGDKVDLICKGIGNGSITGSPKFTDCLFPEEYADIVINLVKTDAVNTAQQYGFPRAKTGFEVVSLVLLYKANEKEIQADCKEANKNCSMASKKVISNQNKQEFIIKDKKQIKALFDKYNITSNKDEFDEQINRLNKTEKESFINELYEVSPYIAIGLYYSKEIKERKLILSFDELIDL